MTLTDWIKESRQKMKFIYVDLTGELTLALNIIEKQREFIEKVRAVSDDVPVALGAKQTIREIGEMLEGE